MSKVVFVEFDERTLMLEISSSAGSSDTSLLREKLKELSVEDEDLRSRIEESAGLRFKTKYVKKDGVVVFFEIRETPNYKVCDEAELKLVFSPRERPAPAPLSAAPPADRNGDLSDQGTILEEMVLNPPAIEVESVPAQDGAAGENEGLWEDMLPGSVVIPLFGPAHSLVQSPVVQNPSNGSSESTFRSPRQPSPALPKEFREPVALPAIEPSSALGQAIAEKRLTEPKHLSRLISFFAGWINAVSSRVGDGTRCLTNRVVYDRVAAAVVKKYPETAYPGSRPHGVIAKKLSASVRKKRHDLVKDAKSSEPPQKRSRGSLVELARILSQAGPSTSATDCPENESDAEPQPSKDDEVILAELLSKQHLGAQVHIKNLLRSSFDFRRKWLSWKNSGSASTSTEKFPQLLNDDLLTYEVSLIHKVTLENMIEKLSQATRTLAQVFKKELSLSSDIPRSEEPSDSIKCSVFQCLAKKLAPRQLSKHATPLITVSTAAASSGSKDLECMSDDGPRLIIYLSEEKLACAFVVADATVKIKIKPTKSVEECVLIVLCAYHAWHIGYPKGYKMTLEFLDELLFGVASSSKNITFRDFQKAYLLALKET